MNKEAPQIVAVVVSSTEQHGRHQLVRFQQSKNYTVRYLDSSNGQITKEAHYSWEETEAPAWGLAWKELQRRVEEERQSQLYLREIQEFSMYLTEGAVQQEGFACYFAEAKTIEEAIANVEEQIESQGHWNLDALKSDPAYSGSIASLIRSAEDADFKGIALLLS